jgi:transposase
MPSRSILVDQHRGRHPELTEWRLQGIGEAMSAIRDRAVIEAKRMVVQVIARVLRTLLEGIAALDGKIAEAAEAYPDFFIFQSFPGAGAAMAPRLLAALGSQRDRYASAEEVQKYSGIAPVTERSGKKKWVHFRWACPKFLRQSFHEWAGHSIAQSVWARAYYQQQRQRGKDHHAAVASLGFQMDSHRVSLLARRCGVRREQVSGDPGQAWLDPDSCLGSRSNEPVKFIVDAK